MTSTGLDVLSESACWERLAAGTVGRLAVCVDDQPVVLPVDYWVHEHRLIVRTVAGTKATAAALGAAVAFELDDVRPTAQGGGWSVLAKGRLSVVTGPELQELLALGPAPSVGGAQRLVVLRVDVTDLTGRRVGAPVTPPGAGRSATRGPDRPARDHAGMEVIARRECMELLSREQVGRLAFVHVGVPVVLPVAYAVDGAGVVFRTAPGSRLDAAIMDRPVAFEVDHFDDTDHSGWSVVVRGTASWLDDRDEPAGVDVPTSWAGAVERTHWVRVRPSEVTGRRIPSPTT